MRKLKAEVDSIKQMFCYRVEEVRQDLYLIRSSAPREKFKEREWEERCEFPTEQEAEMYLRTILARGVQPDGILASA